MKKCRHMPKLSHFLFKNHRYRPLVCKNCGKKIIPASGKKVILCSVLSALALIFLHIVIRVLMITFPVLKNWYFLIALVAGYVVLSIVALYYIEKLTGYWTEYDEEDDDAAVSEIRADELIAESEKLRDGRNADPGPRR